MDELAIFTQALDIESPTERAAFVQQACGADAVLRGRVEALLHSHQAAGSFLDAPLFHSPPTTDQPVVERPGTVIGHYKLIEQIGEGGMGTVWMAQQSEPVKRLVAIKLIKAGMDSRQVIARFEAERQALALMDHPNIARVLDGGTTSAGRPYFVMDLVRGTPITQYCDEHHLTPRQRLELFIPVCQAIQHAHQKGIIHRDLKPSNVLVAMYDGRPVPKVIDFGVAKAAGQTLTEQTLVTGFGSIVGTLEYMSPEQAEVNQLDIDTRSDIYSLGVLLYELLTGSPPFSRKELEQAGMLEMLRVIREVEPSKPSTKLSTAEGLPTLAANRGTEPAKLTKLVRGELDWIVMKALEKDRSRRYETASGFAMDVQRYLDDEPVQACPPSAAYRFRKFARRNKGAFLTASAAAMVVLLVLIGLAVSNVLITQEKNKKVAALQQAKINEDVAKTQKALAERNARTAAEQSTIALANEKTSKTNELLANRRFYAAQMNLAMQAWQAGMLPRVLELLEGQRPRANQDDLRGFEWFYLWGLCNSGRRASLHGHGPGQAIPSVAFSPDGTTLASASWDGTVRLWDPATGREHMMLRGDPKGVWEVAFSPDGKILASGGHDSRMTLILWDVSTGKPLHKIAESVAGLAFAPDSQTLAAGAVGADGVHATLWNVATGEEQVKLTKAGLVVGFLPDGKTLVTATNRYQANSEVRFWNLETKTQRLSIPVPGFMKAALSHDRKRLATSGSGPVKLWDTATGKEQLALSDHGYVRAMAFSPDGKRLATGDELRTVLVWDVETGRLLGQEVHLDPVWGLAFSPDGKTLASSTTSGAIKLWDMTPAEEATTISIPAEVMSLSFSTDGRTLIVGNRGPTKLIDVATGKENAVLPIAGVGTISADGNTLAGWGDQDTRIVWDARTQRQIASLPQPRIENSLLGLTLSPDGKTLATFYGSQNDNTVKLWDLATRQPRTLVFDTPQSNRNSVRCAAFSADGKLLAAGFQFQWITVWEVASGKVKLEISQSPSMLNVVSLAFAPGDQALAVGTDVGKVTLWEIETGKRLASYLGHTNHVGSLAFSPDGKTLATAGADKTVRLWDVATGQERSTLTGHQSGVHKVVFDSTGNTLASASRDGAVKLWRAATDPEATARRTRRETDDPYYHTAGVSNYFAWQLSTAADPLERDPVKAVALANRAVALAPRAASFWQTLAIARYRAGAWQEAITALEKSQELAGGQSTDLEQALRLKNGGAGFDWFFLAMSHRRLGNEDQARAWYDKAVEWMDQNQSNHDGLRRFRTEATELLKIEQKKD